MPRERLPWHVASPAHGCCNSVGIQDAEDNMVADVVYREDGTLISAAPDMFEALADCIVSLCAANLEHLPSLAKARAALAKAEGRDAA